jgi:hypothetical protein
LQLNSVNQVRTREWQALAFREMRARNVALVVARFQLQGAFGGVAVSAPQLAGIQGSHRLARPEKKGMGRWTRR